MRFPDCRTDKYYNQKFLDDNEKEYVSGFDWAVEQITNLLEHNMDVYELDFDIAGEDINLARFLENHEPINEMLVGCVEHWMESERNQLITALLDEKAAAAGMTLEEMQN